MSGKIVRIAACLLIFILLFTASSFCQNKDEEEGYLGVKLIDPPGDDPLIGYYKFELAPGKSSNGKIMVTNFSNKPVTIDVFPADAYSTPDGVLAGSLINEGLKSCGKWVAIEKTKDIIPAKGRKTYSFKFNVPENTSPGDYFGFVFVQINEESNKKPDENIAKDTARFQLNIVKRIGIVIWERAPGEHTRELELTDIKKEYINGNLLLSFIMKNNGNTFIKPILEWELAGSQVGKVLERKPELFGYVLPGTSANVRIQVKSRRPLPRGGYKLKVKIKDEKSTFTKERNYEITLP